jgi:hypothetical protein
MLFQAPQWVATDWCMKYLAEKHAEPSGFSRVPAASIRELAAKFGKPQAEVLKRYGWWADSGNRWL